MHRKYIIDTNIILLNPYAVYDFTDGDVIVPITVIEELDRFKKNMDQTGRHAREFSRMLDELRRRGSLSQGVAISEDQTETHLQVVLVSKSGIKALPKTLQGDTADNHILAVAYEFLDQGNDVVFVTHDTNLRIKADALGIRSIELDTGKVEIDELYSGHTEVHVSPQLLQSLFDLGYMEMEVLGRDPEDFYGNQFVMLCNAEHPGSTGLTRYHADMRRLQLINADYGDEGIWGIIPRNREQRYALDVLLDDSIKLVSLVGIAGTGKTLLAIAAGLLKVADESKYKKLLVSRPVFPMGKDLGYLPGSIKEKLQPWMAPIYDNVDFLIGHPDSEINRKGCEELLDQGIMEIEALTYIRGRSLPYQYLIVDEAQNLTPHEIKTIITRAGEGTKVVFTGDPYQIDNPYVDSSSNGLSFIVEKFKGQSLAAHVTLRKGERSALAELAANLL